MFIQIDVQEIVAIAKEAGSAIMRIYNQDFNIEYKGVKRTAFWNLIIFNSSILENNEVIS